VFCRAYFGLFYILSDMVYDMVSDMVYELGCFFWMRGVLGGLVRGLYVLGLDN